MSDKEHKIEYRVVRRQSKDGDEWLSMQEVYFDGEDKAYAHTVDLDVTGDSLSEIRKKLQSMLWGIDKDIINEIQNDVMEDDMEKRMLDVEMENAELRDRLEELGETVTKLEGTYRGDEWIISQFNRNRAPEEHVSTIEEMEDKLDYSFRTKPLSSNS